MCSALSTLSGPRTPFRSYARLLESGTLDRFFIHYLKISYDENFSYIRSFHASPRPSHNPIRLWGVVERTTFLGCLIELSCLQLPLKHLHGRC
jgi:hypothetical protein